MKQIIVLRKDLNMRKGKMVAQGAHASVTVVQDILNGKEDHPFRSYLKVWNDEGMTKIVVGVATEEELINLHKKALAANLPTALIKDAGRTEFAEPTFTCIAIGPAPEKTVDIFTGELKLL